MTHHYIFANPAKFVCMACAATIHASHLDAPDMADSGTGQFISPCCGVEVGQRRDEDHKGTQPRVVAIRLNQSPAGDPK